MKIEYEWKEGKPKEDGWYLTTYDGEVHGDDGERFVGMTNLENGEWVETTVYAWTDLPEPYMGG